jgi:hypothetical protein
MEVLAERSCSVPIGTSLVRRGEWHEVVRWIYDFSGTPSEACRSASHPWTTKVLLFPPICIVPFLSLSLSLPVRALTLSN